MFGTRSPCLFLAAFAVPPLRQGVQGQQNPTCDEAQADAANWLDIQDKCDDSPVCECGYTNDGYFYGACTDENVQCSSLDSSVCGTQSSAVVYGFDSTTLELLTSDVYVWQYTSGRTESLTWVYPPDGSCTFSIEDTSGATTSCTCQWTNCNGAASTTTFLSVDCSNCESGAVADECLDGFGVSTGSVLEGLAVTFGGKCIVGGDDLIPGNTTQEPTTDTISGTSFPTPPSTTASKSQPGGGASVTPPPFNVDQEDIAGVIGPTSAAVPPPSGCAGALAGRRGGVPDVDDLGELYEETVTYA